MDGKNKLAEDGMIGNALGGLWVVLILSYYLLYLRVIWGLDFFGVFGEMEDIFEKGW
jgi:hypothetical protein